LLISWAMKASTSRASAGEIVRKASPLIDETKVGSMTTSFSSVYMAPTVVPVDCAHGGRLENQLMVELRRYRIVQDCDANESSPPRTSSALNNDSLTLLYHPRGERVQYRDKREEGTLTGTPSQVANKERNRR
jgi:hypothetical protein